jgi:hypothetical protein
MDAVRDFCLKSLSFKQEREQTSFRLRDSSRRILETFKESMSLEIRARDKDVQTYLAGHMTRLPSFVLSSLDLQNEVKATISKAVDGMCV